MFSPPTPEEPLTAGRLARMGVASGSLRRGTVVKLGPRTPSGRFFVTPIKSKSIPSIELVDPTDLVPLDP